MEKNKVFKNRVYGTVGIGVKSANLNADFYGMPRVNTLGEYFATDVSLKHLIKFYWDQMELDEKLLMFKSMTTIVDESEKYSSIVPRTLEERILFLFPELEKKATKKGKAKDSDKAYDNIELLKKVYSCLDVRNFGAVVAIKNNNFSVNGNVQFGFGFNKMDYTTTETITITSPFVDSTKESSSQTTLGSKSIINEGHYFFDMILNPNNNKQHNEYLDLLYSEDDYEKLKIAAMKGANMYNSTSKKGCYNEFGLFVKFKEDSKKILSFNITDAIRFEYIKEGKNEVYLDKIEEILSKNYSNDIELIEVYYNDTTLDLVHSFDTNEELKDKVIIKTLNEI